VKALLFFERCRADDCMNDCFEEKRSRTGESEWNDSSYC
jgi:hypothetical protein